MDETKKSKKLYYNYKISLQWASTNYNYNKNTARVGQAKEGCEWPNEVIRINVSHFPLSAGERFVKR